MVVAIGSTAQVKNIIRTRTGVVNQLKDYGFVSYMGINYYPIGKDSLLAKAGFNLPDSIIIPSTLTIDKRPYAVVGVKESGFSKDHHIQYIKLPSSVTEIQSAAFDCCHRLTECVMPGVKYIGGYAFFQTSLKRVVIPEGCEYIGQYAFAASPKIKYVELPSSLEYIGDYAFDECRIDTIKVHFTQPIKTGSRVWYWRYDSASCPKVLSVPAGSKEAFANDEKWKYCKTIIEH